ncbi:Hypothetical predicted protein [Paramuricea clavata]|uniref:Uncharacterized protein n=1 Tax=Paramuricea clavata TaxID=317549 RepID=A0A6S7FKL0_PARCT|nr:Hypothetical predicted protein [Paramuricea clavata]
MRSLVEGLTPHAFTTTSSQKRRSAKWISAASTHEPCRHSDAERTLHGTWVTLELEKALEKGYKLVRIDEVWHWSSPRSPQPTLASSSAVSWSAQLNLPVLYFDTDSMIYVAKEGEWEPSTESYFGELTDEFDVGPITTFVSGGPKNYAYETNNDKTVC